MEPTHKSPGETHAGLVRYVSVLSGMTGLKGPGTVTSFLATLHHGLDELPSLARMPELGLDERLGLALGARQRRRSEFDPTGDLLALLRERARDDERLTSEEFANFKAEAGDYTGIIETSAPYELVQYLNGTPILARHSKPSRFENPFAWLNYMREDMDGEMEGWHAEFNPYGRGSYRERVESVPEETFDAFRRELLEPTTRYVFEEEYHSRRRELEDETARKGWRIAVMHFQPSRKIGGRTNPAYAEEIARKLSVFQTGSGEPASGRLF